MFRTLGLRIMGSRGLVPLRGRSEEGAEPPSFFSSVVIATYTLLLSSGIQYKDCTGTKYYGVKGISSCPGQVRQLSIA